MQKSSVVGDNYTVKSPNLSKSNFVSCYGNTLHTHKNKTLAIHAYSLFPNSAIKSYIDDMGVFCDSDVYALNILLTWLHEGCISKNKPMKVAIFSARMNDILKKWLGVPIKHRCGVKKLKICKKVVLQ